MWRLLVLGLVVAGSSLNAHAQAPSRTATQPITRLAPDAFPRLGAPVRNVLVRMRCTIPQPSSTATPHNVIRGRFISARSSQWAILCSRDRTSTVLVIDDAGKVLATLGRGDDVNYMQGNGHGTFVYAREIAVVHPAQMRTALQRNGNPGQEQTLRLDHDGIDDRFVESASITFFWSGGKWVEFVGED